jgi:transcription elongation factor Elf1
MKIHVCTRCGSGNVLQDVFVHYNDRKNVQAFDDIYCENCESFCETNEVEVPDDFDVYSDIYYDLL